MRYVVGYTARSRGEDAINLAATLGGSEGATLEIVVILPVQSRTYDRYTPDRTYYTHLEDNARGWLDRAMQQVPQGIKAIGRIYHAESIAEGLIRAATDPANGEEAALIVVGASGRGPIGRMTAGSVANGLLHSSPVPVALATAGYSHYSKVTRITAAMGSRTGADALLNVAIDSVRMRKIPLRLISLVALDAKKSERDAVAGRARRHTQELMAKAREALADDIEIETAVGMGRSIRESVQELPFRKDEIVLVGSSRLARRRRLFLGAAASKMLRALPAPMIVVPRNYTAPVGDHAYDKRIPRGDDALLEQHNDTI